jgi:N-acetylglucosaminyl-diphospho-decaprenol L-rhamnosyltransferase
VEVTAEKSEFFREKMPPMATAFRGMVSVVTVTFRTGSALPEAVAAILAQPQVGELIVVNNGNPPAVLRWLSALAEDDGRVRVVSGHGNIGFAAGCNLGASLARKEYLLLLNPDCILPPGGLALLLQEGEAAGGSWLIGGRLLDRDGSEQSGGRRLLPTPWRALVEATRLYRWPGLSRHRVNAHQQPLPPATVPVPVISGACMLMPATAYRRCGGMDEGYFLHVEDVDFCLRFGKEGGEVLFCPHVSLLHYKGSSAEKPTVVEWHKSKSLIRYFYRHFAGTYPPGFLSLVSAGILARFAGLLLLHAVRDRGAPDGPPAGQPLPLKHRWAGSSGAKGRGR